MAIVSTVEGRLLRFDGAAFHSVPKPPDRYLLSEDEDEIEEYLEDEELEDDDAMRRSVLLFNTWPEGSGGPRGVLADPSVDAMPDGIVVEDDDEDDDAKEDGTRRIEESKIRCNPFEEWTPAAVERPDGDATRRDVNIPLMGNPTRRVCTKVEDVLEGNVASDSFYGRKVSLVPLEGKR